MNKSCPFLTKINAKLEEKLKIEVFKTKAVCSAAAADRGADILKQAIAAGGRASFIAATGASQFDFLKALTQKEGMHPMGVK